MLANFSTCGRRAVSIVCSVWSTSWSYVLSSRANQIGAYQKSEAMEAHREVQAPQPAAPHLILARQGHLGPSGLFLLLYYIILERVDHPRTVPFKHIITSQFWRYYQHEQGKALNSSNQKGPQLIRKDPSQVLFFCCSSVAGVQPISERGCASPSLDRHGTVEARSEI